MTTKAQWNAAMPTFTNERLVSLAASQEFHIARSEDLLVKCAEYPPIAKEQKSLIANCKSILRMIRAEQKARKAVKVAA
jgi:hypothetical protein